MSKIITGIFKRRFSITSYYLKASFSWRRWTRDFPAPTAVYPIRLRQFLPPPCAAEQLCTADKTTKGRERTSYVTPAVTFTSIVAQTSIGLQLQHFNVTSTHPAMVERLEIGKNRKVFLGSFGVRPQSFTLGFHGGNFSSSEYNLDIKMALSK